MLEIIPFTDQECLICVFLGPKGRWMLLNQISRLVFDWDVKMLKRKILFNAMTTGNKYKIMQVTDSTLLEQLRAIHVISPEEKSVQLISVASLDLFIKSYSRRLSKITRLYDTVHRLQWGSLHNNNDNNHGNTCSNNATSSNSLLTKRNKGRKRTLTSADKKVIAAMQQWRCALCGQILPARYTLPFLFCL
jgi:hypothetical protein